MIKIRFIAAMALICALLTALPAARAEDNCGIRVFIDGAPVTPRDARGRIVQPLLIDGTTFLPVRAIGEAFGRYVSWDEVSRSVFVGERPAIMPPRGANIRVFIDGAPVAPRDAQGRTVHPFIRGGTTFLPVRAIGEAFGKAVHWDAANASVFVGRGTFTVTAQGQTHTITMADILALPTRAVTASPRGQARHYTGVPFASVLRHAGVDYAGANSAVFESEDGFAAALSIAESLDARNAFIVIEQDGEPLGTLDTGGRGPFMLVVALDPFSNRFVRYLTSITLS